MLCLPIRALRLGLLLPLALPAQRPHRTPAANPAAHSANSPAPARDSTYAREPVVVEQLSNVYHYQSDGTGDRLETAVVRVQNEAGVRGYGVLAFPYTAEDMRAEMVYARVRKPNGSVIATPVADAEDQPAPLTQVAPQFSDRHLLLLPVKGLAPGDRLEYQVRWVTIKARIPGQFWGAEDFGRGRVVLEHTLELHVPAGKPLQVVSPDLPPRRAEEPNGVVYRWTGSQLRPTVRENTATAGAEERVSQLPEVEWTTFARWEEVGAWFQGLLAPAVQPTPAVKAKADAVVYGLRTPDARAKAIFAYVSHEIRSIEVPWGEGSYAPHAAEEVLSSQLGDSKDKAVLLLAMFQAEGLSGSFALADRGGEVNPLVPAPFPFNEALVALQTTAREPTWLNPMPETSPFGLLDASFRGQHVLLVPTSGEATLATTPQDLPYAAYTRFQSQGKLSREGALTAHIQLEMLGDDELRTREALQTAGAAQADRVAANYLERHGLLGAPADTTVDNLGELDKPLRWSFDLNRNTFGDWASFRIAPLEPGLELSFANRQSSPGIEVNLGGKRTESAHSELLLPPNFSLDLPAAVHLHTAFADLDKTYQLSGAKDGQTLVVDRTLKIHQGRIPASDWTAYRQFLDGVRESEPVLQLTTSAGGPGKNPPPPGSDNPSAARAVIEAQDLLRRGDTASAALKLSAAERANPKQSLLWSTYAALAQATGKPEEAQRDLRREVEFHPEEGAVSQQLAKLLAADGKSAEAIQVLRAAQKQNPSDQAVVLQLAELLAVTNPAEAESLLRPALASAPDNARIKVALGEVLLKQRKTEEATSLLVAAANTSDDPGVLNNAAYTLAEANLQLRVAEAAARRAVQLLNLASTRRDSFPNLQSVLVFTQRLIASWDTFGFVLLREGNTSEAEIWLRAAWTDSHSALASQHYAALLNREGRGAEAREVQRLAGGTQQAQRVVSFSRPHSGPSGQAVFYLEYMLNADPAVRFGEGDQSLADLTDVLRKVNTGIVIPPGTVAHLLWLGQVRCGAGASCTLSLLPPESH